MYKQSIHTPHKEKPKKYKKNSEKSTYDNTSKKNLFSVTSTDIFNMIHYHRKK